MSVVETKECAVSSALELMTTFAAEKMCRKCVPCVQATAEIVCTLERLIASEGETGDADRLRLVTAGVRETVMCKLGRDVADQLEQVLEENEEEFVAHEQGSCPRGSCTALLAYTISSERCTMCGACKEVCPTDAVVGETPLPYLADYPPFRIRADRCIGCGLCVPVCGPGAIEVR